jgi:hypothetical protein
MDGAPRKPATKFPHLRKQMQRDQIAKSIAQLKKSVARLNVNRSCVKLKKK